VQNKQKAGFIR